MPIRIDTDLVTLLGTIFGVAGVFIAILQTMAARRARRIYQSFCRDKGKEIVGLAHDITEEVVDACETLDGGLSFSDGKVYPHDVRTVLAAKINGIRVLTSRLASYCERVNDEHKDTFGCPIFADIDKEIPQRKCLSRVFKSIPELSGIEPRTSIPDGPLHSNLGNESPVDDSGAYQSTILEHSTNPRNAEPLIEPTRTATLSNPSCGDRAAVYTRWKDDLLAEITCVASGCAICKAAASLMTVALKGKRKLEVEMIARQFNEMLIGSGSLPPARDSLGALAEIRRFPARIQCATLPWRSFAATLQDQPSIKSQDQI